MKNKLKSIAVPKTWTIKRKKNIWTMKPVGGHRLEHSLPVSTLLKVYLKHAKTTKETRSIVNLKGILVDGRKIKKINIGVGIMDILEIPVLKEKYVMMINQRGQLYPLKTDLTFKIAKITNKTRKGNKTQLNLFGGQNLIVDKDSFKVGDTITLDLKEGKVKDHIKFAEGASCMLLGGSHIGEIGNIKKIEDDKIIISGKSGNEFETLKKFIYVIGKDKPLIKIDEK
jgi:small subunit ribosomal protein S4e